MTNQSRPFAVFDIDGTIIRWQLYHAIVRQLALTGSISSDASSKIISSRQAWRDRVGSESFGAYEQTVVEAYHEALTNLKVEDFTAAVATVFESYKDQTYTYTRNLLKSLKAKGYLLFAVSGSHQEIVQMLGEYYGFDEVVGAKYHTKEGRYTGEYTTPILTGKGPIVKQLVHKHAASWQHSFAVGDSLSDAPMLELVENPIAFNPNKQLFAQARSHHWKVVVERKDMTYILEPSNESYALTNLPE